jgi:hypothetical protein
MSMTRKKSPDKLMTQEEVESMMIQHQKDAVLPSLLYVTRKLGEVDGMISMQNDPDKTLVDVQRDLNCLYNKLIEEAGVELLSEGTLDIIK